MTILITGSSGKTAAALAEQLRPSHRILIASRTPKSDADVKFDWLDETTWSAAFSHKSVQDSPINAIYLCTPDVVAAIENVIPFVKFAIGKNVQRFVLLSAWEVPENGPLHGQNHSRLKSLEREGIEWTVLRPHFFMENFSDSYHLLTIRDEGKIYTAAGKGTKPFVAASDIAAVAFRALTDGKPHNTDYIITGSQSLTYSEVAAILSDVLGKEVEHVSLSPKDFEQKLIAVSAHSDIAAYLAELDVRISHGYGSETTQTVKNVTGRDPKTFKEFATEKRKMWL
nr:putative oxidoreductase yesf [Quercus suber]